MDLSILFSSSLLCNSVLRTISYTPFNPLFIEIGIFIWVIAYTVKNFQSSFHRELSLNLHSLWLVSGFQSSFHRVPSEVELLGVRAKFDLSILFSSRYYIVWTGNGLSIFSFNPLFIEDNEYR